MLTALGDIEVSIPRTRHFSPVSVAQAYARRSGDVDRAILACFVLGLSTRKVAEALLPILGERVSPSTVSRVSRVLDAEVEAFHRRPLRNQYRVLQFDGVILSRKTTNVTMTGIWVPYGTYTYGATVGHQADGNVAFRVSIQTDTGGVPSGTAVANAYSSTLDFWGQTNALGTRDLAGWFAFQGNVSLVAGTRYHLVVDTVDAGGYVALYSCTGSASSNLVIENVTRGYSTAWGHVLYEGIAFGFTYFPIAGTNTYVTPVMDVGFTPTAAGTLTIKRRTHEFAGTFHKNNKLERRTPLVFCLIILLVMASLLLPAFAGVACSATVTVAWDPNPEPTVVGYNMYVGTSSGRYTSSVDVGSATTCAISALQEGVTYYLAVTAYDGSGSQSGYSDEIVYTVPSGAHPAPSPGSSAASGGGGGCFIATAAFGSPMAPEVAMLRA